MCRRGGRGCAPTTAVPWCGVRIHSIHHEEGSGLGTLAGPLRELSHELVVWEAWREPTPELDRFGAAISMGVASYVPGSGSPRSSKLKRLFNSQSPFVGAAADMGTAGTVTGNGCFQLTDVGCCEIEEVL